MTRNTTGPLTTALLIAANVAAWTLAVIAGMYYDDGANATELLKQLFH